MPHQCSQYRALCNHSNSQSGKRVVFSFGDSVFILLKALMKGWRCRHLRDGEQIYQKQTIDDPFSGLIQHKIKCRLLIFLLYFLLNITVREIIV